MSNDSSLDPDVVPYIEPARELVVVAPGEVGFRSVPLRGPRDNEVLLKILYSSISHGTERRQLAAADGPRLWDDKRRLFRPAHPRVKAFPKALGYESVGRVLAAGPLARVPIGAVFCVDTPHSDYVLVNLADARHLSLEHALSHVPIELFTFCVRTRVALGAVHDARLVLGDRVVIVGLGVVGLLCLQLALRSGAESVFCIDYERERLRMAEQLGGIGILAGGEDDVALQVKERSSGPGVDVAIEASGNTKGLHDAIRCCRMGGRVVTVGTYVGEAMGLRLGDEWSRNRITLLSSMTTNGCPSREFPLWDRARLDDTAINLIGSRKLRLEELITHRFSFDAAPRAYSLLRSRGEHVLQILFTHGGANAVDS